MVWVLSGTIIIYVIINIWMLSFVCSLVKEKNRPVDKKDLYIVLIWPVVLVWIGYTNINEWVKDIRRQK